MKVVGTWQWFPRFQGNIARLSSDICCGFLLPCRWKALSVSSHSNQRLSFSISKDPASTRNMSRSFSMKFSFIYYTDFCLLVDLYMDTQAYMQKILFWGFWVVSKLQCHQFYWIIHLIPYLLYLPFQLALCVLFHAMLYSCHELTLTFLYY